jgi:hypothetical protein
MVEDRWHQREHRPPIPGGSGSRAGLFDRIPVLAEQRIVEWQNGFIGIRTIDLS